MRKFHLYFTLAIAVLLTIGSVGCSAKIKKEYHLKRASRFFSAGQYDKAEVEYINVLRNDQTNAEAIGQLGVIYFEEGRFQRAAPFIFKGSQLATNNLDLHLKLGFIYLGVGKLKEARDEANFILDRKPQDDAAPILLAEAVRTKQDFAEVRKRLQQLQPQGNKAALAVALGTLSFFDGDIKATETAFQNARSLDPKFAPAYAALGALHWAKNDLKQAEADFKTAADLSPVRSSRRLEYAQFKIQTGNPAAAKILLEDMAKNTPDYIPAWIGLAKIALDGKKFDDCDASLKKVLARDPNNYDALLLNGLLEITRGETAAAITDMERMVKAFPEAARVHYQLGMAYFLNDESEKGMGSLNKALNLDPNFTEATLLLAGAQIKSGSPQSAIAPLKQVIKRQPQIIQAQFLLAEAYRVQGNFTDALATYQQLEKSFPQNSQISLLMGFTWLQKNNNDQARQQFSRVLELAPENLNALEQLVNLDLAEKQYSVALQRLAIATGKITNAAAMCLLKAKVYMTQGNMSQAETNLLKTIDLQPESEMAYLVLGKLYFDTQQNQKALTDLNTVIGKNPKNSSALMLLATIYNQEKNYKSAAAAYEKLLAINPTFSQALNNLAYIYSEYLGQLDRAYELAQKARSLLPNDPSTADTFGWILYRKGQFASATSLLQESANKLPSEPDVQFHLGMTYYMTEQEEPARTALNRALQLNKGFSGREECKLCLSILAIDPHTANLTAQTTLEKRISEKPADPMALNRLASIYQRDGASDKAIATYESALKANPQNVKVMITLAQLYPPKDLLKAYDLAKNAYKLAPDAPAVSYILGRLAYQNGNYKWAFSLLQEAAQNQSANPKVFYDLAKAAYSVGNVSEAKTAMSSALQLGLAAPQSDEAKRFVDLITLVANPTQAITMESKASNALKANPDYAPALVVMAAIAEQKNDLIAAEQNYEKVLDYYPDFAPAQKKLTILYASDGKNLEKAYTLAIKARTVYPNDSELSKALAIIVFKQGDYARAANLLKASSQERNNDAEVFYYLGMAQYNLKKTVESKQNLQQAIKLNLPSKFTEEAKRILTELK